MQPDPIRVNPDDSRDVLDPKSRIDFGKVSTIQHNIKVKSFGLVNRDSMGALRSQFSIVWSQREPALTSTVPDPELSAGAAPEGAISPVLEKLRQQGYTDDEAKRRLLDYARSRAKSDGRNSPTKAHQETSEGEKSNEDGADSDEEEEDIYS
nr:hypothetical protein B0A51_03267 [Rachicladosporium sp. CCFEE 5018]